MRTGCQLGWILASKIHQNLLLDGSWAVLWPSWAVLGRLGGLLRRLEEASKSDAKKRRTKSCQKVRLQASVGHQMQVASQSDPDSPNDELKRRRLQQEQAGG